MSKMGVRKNPTLQLKMHCTVLCGNHPTLGFSKRFYLFTYILIYLFIMCARVLSRNCRKNIQSKCKLGRKIFKSNLLGVVKEYVFILR